MLYNWERDLLENMGITIPGMLISYVSDRLWGSSSARVGP